MSIETGIYTVNWEASPRIITIASSVSEGNAQDLYDTLMYYESLPENMDNPNIATASGKEELAVIGGTTTSVGLTITLLNARYKFADRGSITECVMSGGNVLAVDSAGAKMYPVEPSTNVFADRDLSANATINTVEVSGISQEMAYDGKVFLDTVNGSSGSVYPRGTQASPVNNLADALIICATYHIQKIKLSGDLVITQSFFGYSLEGDGVSVVNLNNQMINGSSFIRCEITGIQNSSFNMFVSCRLTAITNLVGTFVNCFLVDTTPLVLKADSILMFTDCRSSVAGNNSPVFDYSNGGIDLSFRAYSGGIRVINSTDSSNISTYEFIAGKFNFDNSNTAGNFDVRGVIDFSGIDEDATATVNIGGAVGNDSLVMEIIQEIKDYQEGRYKIENNQMIFYKADNVTEVARFNLLDAGGSPSMTSVFERIKV